MKIVTFAVNNFRCISGGLKKNTLDFQESSTLFIFGQNNVGKSTFLRAYEFFYKNTQPNIEDLFRQTPENNIEFELEVELDSDDFKKIEIVAPTKLEALKEYLKDGKFLKIRREFKSSTAKGKVVIDKAENSTWKFDESIWDKKCYGGIGLDNVFQACLPKPVFIKAMPTEKELDEILNEILSDMASKALEDNQRKELVEAQEKIKELQEKMYDPAAIKKYKDEVNRHFSKLFPETEISFSDKDRFVWSENKVGRKFDIHFEQKNGDGEIDECIPKTCQQIGHGAVRSAIFALLLMQDITKEFERKQNRKDYLVLFEEPELFLHPKLMRELRSLIYKVSEDDYPYQILCASHSPQMIDISKPKSSIIRMIKDNSNTELFQINEVYLKKAKNITTGEELKQEMYEVLRFNPFLCEAFYADEVILVEGPTEEIIIRGYMEEKQQEKDVFIVNCGTVNNIPFFQKVFSKFSIKYHVICDTDLAEVKSIDEKGNPVFDKYIQKTIYEQIAEGYKQANYEVGLLRVHTETFEPAHNKEPIPSELRFDPEKYNRKDGKPYNANLYWKNVLRPNLTNPNIKLVPIIKYLEEIFT